MLVKQGACSDVSLTVYTLQVPVVTVRGRVSADPKVGTVVPEVEELLH